MNKLTQKTRNEKKRHFFKSTKGLALSIVILCEIIAIAFVAVHAWVETVSSIKITNEANSVGAIINDIKYTDMLIGNKPGTIDLLDYFEPSGDMHLAPASSADGKTFYFPKANMTNATGFNTYRKGNVNDKNTTYLSASFRLKADTNADFFFWKDSTHSISVDDNIRVSVTAYTEGENPEGTFDPESGKLISNTKIYSNLGGGDAKVIDNTNGDLPSSNNTHVEKFSDHEIGKSSSARLFAVGANETKIVTINVWLQKKASGNTDLTGDMSVSQAIKNLGIISSLTPRHVTLIPTPTWDQSGEDETFYAWCWGATNGDASQLYKLELDANEHYGFDYNGTYQNTLFIRSGNANLTKEYLEANNGEHWNDNTVWNVTEDTSIPNDPVDPTFIIKTINGSTLSGDDKYDPSNKNNISDWDTNPSGRPKKSTGEWADPATVKVAYVTGQGGENPWGALSATSYIGDTTSTHVMEATNDASSKHKDTVHAWPGKKLQLKATKASNDYAFVGWYLNADGTTPASGSYTSAAYEPTAPATASEITYYAKFKEMRTLTIIRTLDGNETTSTTSGTIQINSTTTNSVTVDKGSSVTFSATATTGYTFNGFYSTMTGDNGVSSPVSLDSNATYYARFTTNTHNVNLNTIGSTGSTVQYGNEAADSSVEKTGVKYNSSVTIKANPAAGYKFIGWYTNANGTGTAASTNASYTFTMGDADVTYYAKFEQLDFYLTGYINSADESETTHHFTAGSDGIYTYTYKFTEGGAQYITIYDGTNAYHPGSANAGSGTAATQYNSHIAGDDSSDPTPYYKWKVDACKGTKVTFTWDSVNKTLSWVINSRELLLDVSNWGYSGARYAIWVNNDNAFTSMTKVSDTLYKVTITNVSSEIVFCRMNGSTTSNEWSNVWNQTADLDLQADKNCFKINDYSYGDWSLN